MQGIILAMVMFLWMAGSDAIGQNNRLQVGSFATTPSPYENQNTPIHPRISLDLAWQPSLAPFQFQMPLYVQENPRGYSPLCRTELLLEDRLPVAPWIHLLPSTNSPGFYRGNANVMLKVKGF